MLKKKIYSLMLAGAMLISAAAPLSASATETETETAEAVKITIRGTDDYSYTTPESYVWTETTDDGETVTHTLPVPAIAPEYSATTLRIGDASDSHKYNKDGFPEGGIVTDFPFTVEKEGIYEITDIVAGHVEHTHINNVSIAVDDGDVKPLAKDSTYSSVTALDKDATWGDYEPINLYYYLTQGEHHFKFIVPGHNSYRAGVLTFFDKVEFTYMEDTVGLTTAVIGTDAYVEKSANLNVYDQSEPHMEITGKGSDVVELLSSDTPTAENPMKIKYEFDLLASGAYQLSLDIGKRGNYYAHLSNYYLLIDDQKVTPYAGGDETANDDATYGVNLFWKDLVITPDINLEKGTHTFEICITGARSNGTQAGLKNVLQFFRSATFTRTGGIKVTVNASTTPTINGTTDYVIQYAAAADEAKVAGSYRIWGGSGKSEYFPEEGIIVDYPFEVDFAGVYEVTDLISGNSENKYLSNAYMNIVVDNGAQRHISDDGRTYTSKVVTGLMADYEPTNMYYYLTKGTHHLKLIFTKHLGADYNDRTYGFFNKMEFTYVEDTSAIDPVVLYGTDKYIAVDGCTVSTKNDGVGMLGSFGNGKAVALWNSSSTAELPQSVTYEFDIPESGSYQVDLSVTQATDGHRTYLSKTKVKIDGTEVVINGENGTITTSTSSGTTQNSAGETVTKSYADFLENVSLNQKFNLSYGRHTIEIIMWDYRYPNGTNSGTAALFESATFTRVGDMQLTEGWEFVGFYNAAGTQIDRMMKPIIKVTAKGVYTSTTAKTVQVYIAVYNNGKLVACHTEAKSLAVGENDIEIPVDGFTGSNDNKVKLFIFDGMKPLETESI